MLPLLLPLVFEMNKTDSDLLDRFVRPRSRDRESADSFARTTEEKMSIAKWIDFRNSLETNDFAAEEAICQLYRWANKEDPDEILWFDSPDQALLQVAVLNVHARRRNGSTVASPVNFPSLIATSVLCRLADLSGQQAEEMGSCCQPKWWQMKARLAEVDKLSGSLFRSIQTEMVNRLRQGGVSRFWVDTEESITPMPFQNWEGLFAGADCKVNPNNLSAQADIEYGANLARYVSLLWLTERAVVACRKPIGLILDEAYQPHNPSGPAVVFKGARENWCCWCWHGTPIPHQLIEHPDSISVTDIQKELNLEHRRLLLERFGIARFIEETKAQQLDKDKFGTLYRMRIRGQEPFGIVRVVNSTPEPTGEFKEYFIFVPPNVVSAKEAVAWTFGMLPNDYSPTLES
jgi:hypothetical protein